jgi:hypothetical protein
VKATPSASPGPINSRVSTDEAALPVGGKDIESPSTSGGDITSGISGDPMVSVRVVIPHPTHAQALTSRPPANDFDPDRLELMTG